MADSRPSARRPTFSQQVSCGHVLSFRKTIACFQVRVYVPVARSPTLGGRGAMGEFASSGCAGGSGLDGVPHRRNGGGQ
jgi:hypothetical protein